MNYTLLVMLIIATSNMQLVTAKPLPIVGGDASTGGVFTTREANTATGGGSAEGSSRIMQTGTESRSSLPKETALTEATGFTGGARSGAVGTGGQGSSFALAQAHSTGGEAGSGAFSAAFSTGGQGSATAISFSGGAADFFGGAAGATNFFGSAFG